MLPLAIDTRLRRASCVAAAAAAILLAAPGASRAADALFVASTSTGTAADVRVVEQLELSGFDVTVLAAADVTSGDAVGRDLVLVSESVSSGQVSNKFTASAVPVIVWEPFVYDDMGMTGPAGNVDHGLSAGQQSIEVVGASPLAAGLAGSVTISTQSENISWGVPAPSAIVAATETGTPGHAVLFGYEAGASLSSGTAPARRVGIFLGSDVPRHWTADGVQLFDAAVAWATSMPAPDKARVLALGDSITAGSSTRASFRGPLWGLLADSGCAVDMTGTQDGPAAAGSIDSDHEGHSGFRTDEIAAQLPGWLGGNAPDVVLLHLGTNDVLQSVSAAVAKEELRTIIGQLRAANASVTILLAQIIPNLGQNEAAVQSLNGAIGALAGEETSGASPVLIVDHYTGYASGTLNEDGIHPNPQGEALMAERWHAALLPVLGERCTPPAPVPALSAPASALAAAVLGALGALRLRGSRRRQQPGPRTG